MPSTRQILTFTTLPLLALALPQPQADTWGAPATETPLDGPSAETSALNTWDTWAATPTAPLNTWAGTTAAPDVSAPAESAYNPSAWLTQVTYPAGCESWANPCPSGAIIAGGAAPTGAASWDSSDASGPFSNANTIYTTMTNSDGIITGGPSVGAGVTETPSFASLLQTTVKTAVSSAATTEGSGFGGNSTTSPSSSATTSSGFAQTTTNGAAGLKASAALCALVALVAAVL